MKIKPVVMTPQKLVEFGFISPESFRFYRKSDSDNRFNIVSHSGITIEEGGIDLSAVPPHYKETLRSHLQAITSVNWSAQYRRVGAQQTISYLIPDSKSLTDSNKKISVAAESFGFDLSDKKAAANISCYQALEELSRAQEKVQKFEDLQKSFYGFVSGAFKISLACVGLFGLALAGSKAIDYAGQVVEYLGHADDCHYVEATVRRIDAETIMVGDDDDGYVPRAILNVITDHGTFVVGKTYYDNDSTPSLYHTFIVGQKYRLAILDRTNEDIVFASKIVEPHSKNPSSTVQKGNVQKASPKQYAEKEY